MNYYFKYGGQADLFNKKVENLLQRKLPKIGNFKKNKLS